MAQFKSMTRRSAIMFSLDELQEKQRQETAVLANLNADAERLMEQVKQLRSVISELEITKEVAGLNDTQQAIIDYVNSLPNGADTLQQIADSVGKSKTTVHNYVKKLERLGVLSVNGTIQAVTK